jgi:hypothetical protein
MRYQPNRDYVSNDDIQTPPELARRLVEHFQPRGRVLEPCCGEGNILRLLPPGAEWCEIKRGRDFLQHHGAYDWILTNPPWSRIRDFLAHSLRLADNVVFLMTVNHVWTKARLREMTACGFGLREILLLPAPASFPQTGFQLGAVHFQRGWTGTMKLGGLGQISAAGAKGSAPAGCYNCIA